MIYKVGSSSMSVKLQQYKRQHDTVQKKISSLNAISSGAISFEYHLLRKERRELEDRITYINSVLHPEIIA